MNINDVIVDTGAVDNTATETNADVAVTTETITLSKVDYDKAIATATQSECDKLRTKYSKEIKDLNAQLATYKNAEKSESEIEIEKRLADLEAREKSVALKSALQNKSLDVSFADYLKDSVDVESFSTLIDKISADRVKAQGYVPSGHQNNVGVNEQDWSKMDYDQKVAYRTSNPEMADVFLNRYKA
ncbi:MAG: hypothetical protein LBS21_09390 [Clostridiales bacterium]|jgi:hypothetical protein|nr:hypothetical protein [Clostridiales bacterium]